MRVSKVSIRQNRGGRGRSQYEHEHIELEIEVAEGEKAETAVARGRATLKRLFGEVADVNEIEAMKARIAEAEAETL